MNSKDIILRWVKSYTDDVPGCDVQNFSQSWADGYAFAGLFYGLAPEQWKGGNFYTAVTEMSREERLKWAFQAASNSGIDNFMEAEDVDPRRPDDKSILLFLTQIYKHFGKRGAPRGGNVSSASIDELIAMSEAKRKGVPSSDVRDNKPVNAKTSSRAALRRMSRQASEQPPTTRISSTPNYTPTEGGVSKVTFMLKSASLKKIMQQRELGQITEQQYQEQREALIKEVPQLADVVFAPSPTSAAKVESPVEKRESLAEKVEPEPVLKPKPQEDDIVVPTVNQTLLDQFNKIEEKPVKKVSYDSKPVGAAKSKWEQPKQEEQPKPSRKTSKSFDTRPVSNVKAKWEQTQQQTPNPSPQRPPLTRGPSVANRWNPQANQQPQIEPVKRTVTSPAKLEKPKEPEPEPEPAEEESDEEPEPIKPVQPVKQREPEPDSESDEETLPIKQQVTQQSSQQSNTPLQRESNSSPTTTSYSPASKVEKEDSALVNRESTVEEETQRSKSTYDKEETKSEKKPEPIKTSEPEPVKKAEPEPVPMKYQPTSIFEVEERPLSQPKVEHKSQPEPVVVEKGTEQPRYQPTYTAEEKPRSQPFLQEEKEVDDDSQASEIVEKMFIGNQSIISDYKLLNKHRITHLVQLRTRDESLFEDEFTKTEYTRFTNRSWVVKDESDFEIFDLFDIALNYCKRLQSMSTRTRIMIYDHYGTSLAPTLMTAYLLREKEMDLKSALALVKKKSKIPVRINAGFMEQLEDYDLDLQDERAEARGEQ